MSVRFGLAYDFRNPERWERPWGEVFHALLEQIEYVDTLGFDSIWITEHHFVPDGYAPSPVTLLAAIAARTQNVKLGTDILLLPLYNAVRLAEDLATVDLISGGRLMLGVGMGYRDEEFAAFGQTRRERVGRTEEGIDVLRGAWAEGPFSYEGQYYKLRDVDVTPKPLQTPHPPLFLATTSEPAARRAARLDLNLLPQGGSSRRLRALAGRAREAWQPPEQLIEQLEAYRRTTLPATDLIGWGTPVGMNPEEITPSLERFAKEVIPHFRSR